MRRAIVATAGTVVGLVALLGYKSSGTVSSSHLAVGLPSTSSTTVSPQTTPAPTTAPPAEGTQTTPETATPATTAPATTAATPKNFTGADVSYRYGDIQVRITVSNGKITKIALPQESATDPRSQSINSQAIPILTQEAMAAQNLQFDVVSGATYTSDAFAQALQSALSKAGT